MDHLQIDALFSEALADVAVTEIIRPAAIVPEEEARRIREQLGARDCRASGLWNATPSVWERYDRPWTTPHQPGQAQLIGSMHIVWDSPSRYQITIYRATITIHGHDQGWNVTGLCDEALGYGGLSIATCPRASLAKPPPVFRLRASGG
jgi:hypothetical protein